MSVARKMQMARSGAQQETGTGSPLTLTPFYSQANTGNTFPNSNITPVNRSYSSSGKTVASTDTIVVGFFNQSSVGDYAKSVGAEIGGVTATEVVSCGVTSDVGRASGGIYYATGITLNNQTLTITEKLVGAGGDVFRSGICVWKITGANPVYVKDSFIQSYNNSWADSGGVTPTTGDTVNIGTGEVCIVQSGGDWDYAGSGLFGYTGATLQFDFPTETFASVAGGYKTDAATNHTIAHSVRNEWMLAVAVFGSTAQEF